MSNVIIESSSKNERKGRGKKEGKKEERKKREGGIEQFVARFRLHGSSINQKRR